MLEVKKKGLVTTQRSITKLGITAFEIIYLQIQRVNLKRRLYQARRKHGLRFSTYSVIIIVVVMQSLISWCRKSATLPNPLLQMSAG